MDLAKTLCIVSSKSGSTLEPNILKAFFFDRVRAAVGDDVGAHFVAVTDPGSKMQAVAEGDGFRHVFMGDPAIGGTLFRVVEFRAGAGGGDGGWTWRRSWRRRA